MKGGSEGKSQYSDLRCVGGIYQDGEERWKVSRCRGVLHARLDVGNFTTDSEF